MKKCKIYCIIGVWLYANNKEKGVFEGMTERQKFILDQIPTGELVEYLSDERKVDLNIVDPKKSQYELVTDFLNENGFKINLLGYEYARSIILFALAQEEREQITTMYMIVAEEHNVN